MNTFTNWNTLQRNLIFENRWITLYQDKVDVRGTVIDYTWYQSSDVVVVVPFLDENTLVMIRQFRYPLQKVLLEFPAGHIEDREDIKATATRELLEETGFFTKDIKHVYSYHPSVSKSRQLVHLLIARNLIQDKPRHDNTEIITDIQIVSISELGKMIKEKEVESAGTLIAYLICCGGLIA